MRKLAMGLLIVILAVGVAFAGGQKEGQQEGAQQEQQAAEETQQETKNPNTYVYAGIGDPNSLDPAKAYDTASWEVMTSIYEQLVEFDKSSTSEFKPVLASEVPTRENGGIRENGTVYRFKIREGVTFHNGNELTPEDVEYTFERNMVVDAPGGPNWVWFTYLLGKGGSGDVESFSEIDQAVEVDGQYVVFNLNKPFPPFLSVIANTWGAIVDKEWVIEQGGWPGTAETWKDYNKPEAGDETLYEITNGTGPYKLERWEKDTEVVLTRFEDYWGEKPAMERGINRVVKEWSTRRLMLLQGDADSVYVGPQHYDDMAEESGLKVNRDLKTLNVTGLHFNYDIATQDNPLTGSGQLDGEGIPGDFFNDKDVRLGFAYAWDSETFINQVLEGHGRTPVTPVPFGLPFKNEELEGYGHDMEQAEEHFRQAMGGDVWENGFQFEILYNEGNNIRQVASRLIAENVSQLNDKFQIDTRAVPWPDFLDRIQTSTMPMFVIGWAPDYPDPDNFVTPFMHGEKGTFASWVSYNNERVNDLIEQAGTTLDQEERREMYYELQQIYLDDVVGIMTHQPVSQRFYRDWIEGNFYNPMQSSQFDLLPYIEKEQ